MLLVFPLVSPKRKVGDSNSFWRAINNAESLYFQRFSAFLFFAVVDDLLIANHRFGILWSRSITFSVFSQLAFC